ncbi:MAG: hypothetical protein C0485_07190 [Pirellula sp.]|nr:hypothetical protein [Pirellula sp.]
MIRRAFTLMEIVLAIALTSVVMYLLMTAVELYMIRVDSSRGRVESAQLARTILDQMAADLAAMRLDPPAAAASSGASGGQQSSGQQTGAGQQSGGGNQGGQSQSAGQGQQGAAGGNAGSGGTGGAAGGSGGSASSTAGSAIAPTTTHGIFGTTEELRIDRAAPPNWARASREVDPTEPPGAIDLPRTVRYYVNVGTAQSAQEFAQQGVNVEEETAASVSGLYRELVPTAALSEDADPLAGPASREGAKLELLAPEVVKLELHYFDGEQLVDEWDVVEDAGLPAGVEILLTIHEPTYGPSDEADQPSRLTGPQYKEKDLVVYRRFVRLPKVSPPQPATALLPAAQQNGGGGQPGQGGGPNGGGQSGGEQNAGGQSGQGGGGQNGQGGAGGGQQGGGNGR